MAREVDKGIVYFVWGEWLQSVALRRSIKTAEDLKYAVHVEYCTNDFRGFRKRADLYKSSPFRLTCYLDADTQILDNIDYGFEMADKWGLACCIAPAGMAAEAQNGKGLHPDLPQYNCGVLFWEKEKARKTFERWEELLRENPKSEFNDQPYFAQAVSETINPYVLPKNWNYRPHLKYESDQIHGKIKILHS